MCGRFLELEARLRAGMQRVLPTAVAQDGPIFLAGVSTEGKSRMDARFRAKAHGCALSPTRAMHQRKASRLENFHPERAGGSTRYSPARPFRYLSCLSESGSPFRVNT